MANKLFRFISLIIGLILLGISGNGQSMQFRNISVGDGLSHSYVNAFLQDSQGLMWIGTLDGLNLYTGYSLLKYSHDKVDTNSISNNCIYAILEDSKGIIWLGTENGLNNFNKKTGNFKRYYNDPNNPNSLSHNHIRGLYEDDQHNIWIITYGGGFCKLNQLTGEFTTFQVNSDSTGLLSNKINILFVDSKGLFWLGTESGGISVFDPGTESFVGQFFNNGNSSTINDNTVNSFYEDKKGNYWIGTWFGGLNKYNPSTGEWNYFVYDDEKSNSLPSNTIRDIEYDKDDFLWLATYGGGLCRFNMITNEIENKYIQLNRQGNIAQKNLWCLYSDRQSNLWIGSFGDGLYFHDHLKETFPYYTIKNKNDENLGISAIIEDHTGIVWLGTLDGKLYSLKISENKIEPFGSEDLTFQKSISALFEDKAGRLWVGTNSGLYRISENRKHIDYYSPGKGENSLDNKAIISIFEDYLGNLWIGIWGVGINLITSEEIAKNNTDKTEVIKYLHNPKDTTSISHHLVWDFMEDSHNNLWIATSNMLNKFNRSANNFTRYPDIKTIASLLEDDDGVIWAASLSNGLYKFDYNGNLISRITNGESLNKMVAENLLKDNLGNLWMSSKNYLYKYNPSNNSFYLYTSKYGLQDDNFLINSSAKLRSGALIFGGMKGFNIFQPEIIPTEKEMPNVIITDFKVFNQSVVKSISGKKDALVQSPIFSTDSILLSHQQNVFSIEFAALDYFNPDDVRFLYMLEGFNKEWIETDAKNRIATFTNLKGGEYVFKVKSTDILGKWNSNVKELKIIIKPPYWQTVWFKLLIALLSVLFIAGIFQIRLNQLKQKYTRNQRSVIIENLKKDYELASIQVIQLKEELERKSKKNASLALKQVANNERIDSLILKVKEIKEKTKNTSLLQELNILLHTIETEFKDNSADVDFKDNINLLYDNFIERFAKAHIKLTHKDLKICAYIRMNKTNREIAEILHISKSSLEISRYRIRKKIPLRIDSNLNDYILRF